MEKKERPMGADLHGRENTRSRSEQSSSFSLKVAAAAAAAVAVVIIGHGSITAAGIARD